MGLVTKFLLLLGLLISVRGASGSIGDSCVSDDCEYGLVCDTGSGVVCARVPQNSKAYGESCYGDEDCDTSQYSLTCFKEDESYTYKRCLIEPGTVEYHEQCVFDADCVSPFVCYGICQISSGSVQENGICYENQDCDTKSKPLSCFVPPGESGTVKKCTASCYSECADPTGYQCAYCCFRYKDTFGCPSTGCLKTQTYADCCPASSSVINWNLCRRYCNVTGDSTGDICKCINSRSYENCCNETIPDMLCEEACYEEDCTTCAANGKDVCTVNGLVCDVNESECYEPGQGGYFEDCGRDEDAACGELLYCNSRDHYCYGDGSDGALCSGYSGGGNKTCTGVNSFCDYENYICRARGDGTNNAYCNSGNDDPCADTLICDEFSGKCRPPFSGASGNPCTDLDAPCDTGLACDEQTLICRPAGNGSLGAKCGDNRGGNSSDIADTICDVSADLVCSNHICRGKGNGLFGSFCGADGDVLCSAVQSLVCAYPINSSVQVCILPGDGSIGSSCNGGYDLPCTLPAICDYDTRVCRARGNGGPGAPCGQISPEGDAQCAGSTPVCDSSTRICRAISGGGLGNSCGTGQDPPCSSGLACDWETNKCRQAGNGSAGSPCYGDGDANCTSANPLCDDYGCRAYGDGTSGAPCYDSHDAKCAAANPICDDKTYTCRSGGNGAEGAHCGGQSDLSCSGSLFCDPIFSVCRGWGDGNLNANCGGTADATCKSGNPVCDSVTFKCRVGGTGVAGASCESQGDQACGSLLLCSSNNHKCVGTGVSGSHCSGEGDLNCNTGLFCGIDSTCGTTQCTTGCPMYSACTAKAGCAASLACDKSLLVCRAAGDGSNGANCSSDGDATCTTGFVCGSNNRCGDSGSTPCASQCPKDTTCTDTAQCAAGLICNGVCTDPCVSECQKGTACAETAQCAAGLFCDGVCTEQFPKDTQCTDTAQCAAGLICNGVCSEQSSALSVFIPTLMIVLLLTLVL